ncbi:MAG: DUF1592 domain-containing protein [Myxococcota bacterium]
MRWIWAGVLVLTLGCEGTIGDPLRDNPSRRPGEFGTEDVRFDARLWRLSPQHFNGELERLFGSGVPEVVVPASAPENGLSDIAANGRVDVGNAAVFAEGVRSVATWIVNNLAATRCASYGTDECVDTVAGWLPAEAFRRPVSRDEENAVRALFDELRADYDYDYAFAGMVRGVLLSPDFLYRTELGEEGDNDEVVELTDYEIATLLGFALTDQGPDAELLADAERGRLRDPDTREEHVRRLMGETGPMWQRFFWEWLHMSTLNSQGAEVGLDEALVAQMREEYDVFVDTTIAQDRGTLRELLTATHSWTRPELAAHYGSSHPGSGLERVEHDATQRGGLLTQAAWLVSHGKRGRANVVRRGMGVFIDAMCFDITPPADLDLEAELERIAGPDATVKEIVEARGQDGTCGNCHRLADPIGLVFESFASDGSWQTEYVADGNPVETEISLDGLGTFDRANDFSGALVDDLRFQHCMVQRLAHFMVGIDVGTPDAITWTSEAHAAFLTSDTSFEELLVAIVRHPAFIERNKD